MRDPEASARHTRSAALSRAVAASLEIFTAIAAATAVVAALQSTTPAAGLEVLYLLAVLAVAIRRGEIAALATALLSVLTLNYLFISPRHRLAIAHSQDVVDLIVFLIAAVVVGRLAAAGRQRGAEAVARARIASAREREAAVLADAASAILESRSVKVQLQSIAGRVAAATGATHARVVLEPVPSPNPDETAIRVSSRARAAWLYISDDCSWTRADVERITGPLGRLIDVALERDRVAEQAAETEAARRAEVAKTAILHAVSHDLRSPLTAMTTAGAAMRAAEITCAERSELIAVIETEGKRLARFVDDLLDLSRIQAHAVEPRADWCDLHDAVACAAAHAGGEHPLEFALPTDLPLVRADAAQLERVFSNLIENAVKFSPPGTPVRISGGAGAGRVTIRVTDSGRGIAPQHRGHVFEPFFRGRDAAALGSGLGLAICRGFVEANGGTIVLQTSAGRGTSFAVSFPVLRLPAAAT